MSEDAWYYAIGQSQTGPVTAGEMAALVKSRAVDAGTYVWSDKLTDWMPLAQTELAPLLSGMPPPLPGAPPGGASAAQASTPRTSIRQTWDAVAGSGPVTDVMNVAKLCFAKFVTWQGRANRPEFWLFVLFGVIVAAAASILDAVLRLHGAPFEGLVELVFLLPNLAVGVRRLHDTDRSAWWLLLLLIPIVGFIVLIVFWCQAGTPGRNRYGEVPAPTSMAGWTGGRS